MKLYTVNQYTESEWEAHSETEEYTAEENVINIVWKEKAVCMDIMASGKRIVPILRKIEKAMQAAGLSGNGRIYDGWFDAWADSLTDPSERKYFIWAYSGRGDAERGVWSYSWEIEQIDENQWYIFLNLARPIQEEPTEEETETSLPEYTGKKLGTQYGQHESIIVYGAGQTVSVDRTARGEMWCKEKGLNPAYTVTTDNGEKYTVWSGEVESYIGGTISAACAIPA